MNQNENNQEERRKPKMEKREESMQFEGFRIVPEKKTHNGRRFAAGMAFGALVGSAIGLVAAKTMELSLDSGKVADGEDALKRTGDRIRHVGETARYTIRAMNGRMLKGTNAIKDDVIKGAKDIRDTMQS